MDQNAVPPQFPFEIIRVLGEGTYGAVYKCIDLSKKVVAVKVPKKYGQSDEVEMKSLRRVLEKGYDPDKVWIVKFLGSILYEGIPCLVLECLGWNLYKMIHERSWEFDIHHVRNIGLQLLKALSCLKAIGIVHGDIKPQNILVANSNENALGIKLADLGGFEVDEENPPQVRSPQGTLPYMSPEVLIGLKSSFPVDMWAVALVLVEVFTQKRLFPADSKMDLMHFIVKVLGTDPCFREGCFYNRYFEDEAFTLQEHDEPEEKTYESLHHLLQLVEGKSLAELEDVWAFICFLESALTIDPTKRAICEWSNFHPFFYLFQVKEGDEDYCNEAKSSIF